MLGFNSPIPAIQQQIVDAAIRCITRWGIERITMNDIAYEARLARSTVYSYYKSRDEVIKSALILSAYSFGEKLFELLTMTIADKAIIGCYDSIQ